MLGFSTMLDTARTIYNQYDSLILPLLAWLEAQGVRLETDCLVTDLQHTTEDGKFMVTGIGCLRQGKREAIAEICSGLFWMSHRHDYDQP